MTLKVCRQCKSRPAHSLDKCPQCGSPLDNHGENFLWDHEVDNMLDAAAAVEAIGMSRPKDSDNLTVWRKYAVEVVQAAGNPHEAPDVKKLDKDELIELFG